MNKNEPERAVLSSVSTPSSCTKYIRNQLSLNQASNITEADSSRNIYKEIHEVQVIGTDNESDSYTNYMQRGPRSSSNIN